MAEVYNSVYRDAAGNSSYPLDGSATQTVFRETLLLDASLYIPSTFEPPFFFIRIDGGAPDDAVRFVVADRRRREVCSADCLFTRGSAVMQDANGRSVGVLVYDAAEMQAFKGDIGTREVGFVEGQTKLRSECVRFYDVKELHTIAADDNALTNRVPIAFAGGAYIDGCKRVNVYGENGQSTAPLRSINRIVCEHAFILAHAHNDYVNESALRLETEGGIIRIGKSKDF